MSPRGGGRFPPLPGNPPPPPGSRIGTTDWTLRRSIIEIIRSHSRQKQSSFTRELQPTVHGEVKKEKLTRKEKERRERKRDKLEKEREERRRTRPDVSVKGAETGHTRFNAKGFYWTVTLEFALGKQGSNDPKPKLTDDEKADWGTGFGNPLVNPKRDANYVVRASISQFDVQPLIGGYRLQWEWPAGWSPIDGLGRYMYVECSSNPVIIARLFRSPSVRQKGNTVFRCRVRDWFA